MRLKTNQTSDNRITNTGMTPLQSACMMGADKVVSTLLAHQFDQYATDNMGWNAFMYALYREQVTCVMLLLGLNASGQKVGSDGSTTERAFWHLTQLGCIIHSKGDAHELRIGKVFKALATVPEFFNLINEVVSGYLATSLRESLAFVRKHPYMLNTTNKLALLREEILSAVGDTLMLGNLLQDSAGMTSIRIKLRRHQSWGDFVETVSTTEGFWMNATPMDDKTQSDLRYGRLSILERAVYVMTSRIILNFSGVGEAGCGAGVEKEVFEDISRCLVRDSGAENSSEEVVTKNMICGSPLFMTPGGSTGDFSTDNLIPVPFSIGSVCPTQMEKTCFISFGMLVGHIILRRIAAASSTCKSSDGSSSVCLPLNISNIFWRLVLRKDVTLDDIADADPVMYRSLSYIKDMKKGVDSLDLTFSAAKDEAGGSESSVAKTEVVDLVEGGRDVEVTDHNKDDYIDCMVNHLTRGRLRRQAALTREGIESCVPRELLSSFSERELAFIVAGNPIFDADEWRQSCHYNNLQQSPRNEDVIEWFWKFVHRISQTERGNS